MLAEYSGIFAFGRRVASQLSDGVTYREPQTGAARTKCWRIVPRGVMHFGCTGWRRWRWRLCLSSLLVCLSLFLVSSSLRLGLVISLLLLLFLFGICLLCLGLRFG